MGLGLGLGSGAFEFLFRSSKVEKAFLAVRVLQLVGQPIEAFVEAIAGRGTGRLKFKGQRNFSLVLRRQLTFYNGPNPASNLFLSL